MPDYEEVKTAVQWLTFVVSICLNSLLIYLILTKSPPKMENYKYLMTYFSLFAIFFSISDVIVGPFVHSYGTGFCVLANRTESKMSESVEYALLCVLCGCYGVTITFFAIHFIFRYLALERQNRLSTFFGGWKFAIWLAVPVFFGGVWGGTVAYFLAPTDESKEYLRPSIMESYNLTMEQVTFVGAVYWRAGDDGREHIVMSSLVAILIFTSMMGSSFFVVCFYGYRSYKRINSLTNEGESMYTRNLQRQLYKALVAQTVIPIVLMYLPVSNYLVLPAFGVNIAPFSRLVTFLYAAYPAVDPLPLFFIIDNYRNALKGYFVCPTSKNRVSINEDETSRGQTTS